MTPLEPKRYASIAILLHWLMALGFFWMIASGVIMTYFELSQALKFNLYQWHKASGVLLLLAVVLRLFIKLTVKAPSIPDHFEPIEKKAAKLGHWGFYVFMFMMPLTGWIMVSASIYGLPTMVFNWFQWPHIPNLQGNTLVETIARNVHFVLAILFGLTIFAHIGAVVKHSLKDQVNLVKRMWWKA